MAQASLFTVGAVADKISEHVQASKEAIARLIRTLLQQNAIVPTFRGGNKSSAAALFDETGMYRAAILVKLDRHGLSVETLREIARRLNNEHGAEDDGIGVSVEGRPDRLVGIVRELRQGRPWYFHAYLVPAYFDRNGEVLGAMFSPLSNAEVHPFAHAITLTLPLLTSLPLITEPSPEG